MLTPDNFMLAILSAYQQGIDSAEVVRVMKEAHNIICTELQIEQMYVYFEIALTKPTIH